MLKKLILYLIMTAMAASAGIYPVTAADPEPNSEEFTSVNSYPHYPSYSRIFDKRGVTDIAVNGNVILDFNNAPSVMYMNIISSSSENFNYHDTSEEDFVTKGENGLIKIVNPSLIEIKGLDIGIYMIGFAGDKFGTAVDVTVKP